ncbi:MAG TPA: outer membrane lipoprotein-sorting protein [Opitutaceae bacterium]|nr:outer membrane lipoprotein-sorting protein [Opitutaceae bacterium]
MITAPIFRQMTRVICPFFLCCAVASTAARAQPKRFRPAPEYAQIGKPDQQEGAKILREFQARGLYSGQNYIEFEFVIMPRRGDEKIVPGRMWSSRTDKGPISRLVLFPGQTHRELRLLVQSGPEPAAWQWRADSPTVQKMDTAAFFQPLAETDVTLFDLQLSFLYWRDFVFEGVSKLRGRPAHVFLLYPPSGVATEKSNLTGVRVYLDTQYSAPVQFEELGADAAVLKTVSVVDLKKIGDQWLVKSIDFRDETTRNKSRFSMTGAKTGADFSSVLFEPANLSESIAPPPVDQIQKIGL